MKETPSIDVWIAGFDEKLRAFPLQTQRILKLAGRDAIEMIRRRIQTGGGGVDDKFTDYSVYWEGVRKRKGMQTGYKDFDFTGDMWKSTKEIESSPDRVVIGPTGAKNRLKAEYNVEREDQYILDVTPKERQIIERNIERMVIKFFT